VLFLKFSNFLEPLRVGHFAPVGHGVEFVLKFLDFSFESVFKFFELRLMANFEFAFFVLKSFLEESFLDINLVFMIFFEEPDSFFVTVLLLLEFFL
jgi:hypothetical protein